MTLGRTLAVAGLAAVTAATFAPVRQHGFLNWDDADALVSNPHLQQPLSALATWAFSTFHMGHYQPLSWLTFAVVGGTDPGRVHVLALGLHALNAALLLVVAARLARADGDRQPWLIAAAAVALFAVHPLRVEPVAWASALPYLLSYAPLVVSVLCWITWTRDGRAMWWWATLVAFTVSQLARVTAPLFPLVLALLAHADRRALPRTPAMVARALAPIAVVALAVTIAEVRARDVESLANIGLDTRVASALAQPALYVWRTLAPGALNPLDVLPRAAQPEWGAAVVGTIAAAVVGLVTWQLAGVRATLAVWGSYLLLLVPFLGLTASGLQATADRYTYGPAMVLSVALAVVMASSATAVRQASLVAAGAAAIFFAQSARAQLTYWHDSVSLWSRSVALDADNDVARYNLALARIDAGQTDLAIDDLQRLITLVPDHDAGRRQLATLVADREQRTADRAAAAGRFLEAMSAYDRALAADPSRVRARLNRGMARLEAGQLEGGSADLEAAMAAGIDDLAVVNALAFAWAGLGRGDEAIALLRRARAAHPDDIAVAGNLARLLVTASPVSAREPEAALALAAAINDATGGGDPRVLDTLALALAATGRRRDAAEALDVAVTLAREQGDRALADALTRRRAALGR